MINFKLLQSIRKQKGIDEDVLASFIGITYPSYRDIEWGLDDLTQLTVIQTMRLTMALKLEKPSDLLNSDSVNEQTPSDLGKNFLLKQDYDIAQTIRQRLPEDLKAIEDELGWQAHVIESWLKDKEMMGTMETMALADICNHIRVSFVDVLDRYWGLLVGVE